MDSFDRKIKHLAESEVFEIPDNVDNSINDILENIDNPKSKKKRPFKVAILVATISALTITTVFAIENIIEYFNHNKNSIYKPDEKDFTVFGSVVNKSVKDKNIEFTVDNISIDDNYINIFYTVKSNENIKNIDESYKDPYVANPIPDVFMNGENITPYGLVEHEATFVSDKELKGMRKVDVSNQYIKDNSEIEIKVNEIFKEEGNWSIKVSADKTDSKEHTYNYDINKRVNVNLSYDYNGKKVDVEHKLDIKKVSISPFASKINIKEKSNKVFGDWRPMIGNSFALFDENNKSLDVVDKGGFGPNANGEITASHEFLKANKDTKSLTLVPIEFDDSVENHMLEPKSIDNLPIVFKTSKYGNLVLEDLKISDKEIRYTFYKDGVVPYYPNFWFFDENGNEISISSRIEESLDRHTGRYTVIHYLQKDSDDVSKIKKVSTFTGNDLKLRYDQQVKIDLIKNN
ncbi:DUF4179 domain-containing protein [Faecalimicrobium sp. JNUCC 81]